MTQPSSAALEAECPNFVEAFIADHGMRVFCSKSCALTYADDCQSVERRRFRVAGVLNDTALAQLALRRLRCDGCFKHIHPLAPDVDSFDAFAAQREREIRHERDLLRELDDLGSLEDVPRTHRDYRRAVAIRIELARIRALAQPSGGEKT